MSVKRNTTTRDRDRQAIRRTKPPCGICGLDIDYTLTTLPGSHGRNCKGDGCAGCTPHPMRYEVDHILPLDSATTPEERAALDTLGNKQASHRACNREKWHRLAPTGPRVYVTDRTW